MLYQSFMLNAQTTLSVIKVFVNFPSYFKTVFSVMNITTSVNTELAAYWFNDYENLFYYVFAMADSWLLQCCLSSVWDKWIVAKRCEIELWLLSNTNGNLTPEVQNPQWVPMTFDLGWPLRGHFRVTNVKIVCDVSLMRDGSMLLSATNFFIWFPSPPRGLL